MSCEILSFSKKLSVNCSNRVQGKIYQKTTKLAGLCFAGVSYLGRNSTQFESFLGIDAQDFVFLSGFFYRPLFVSFFVVESGCLGLLKQGFRIESIAKINFHRN